MAASHKRDYYEVLVVTRTATAEEIKSAYRKAALKWHPDRHATGKKEAEAHFREASEAYSVLSDGNKRAAYDRYGHAGLASGGFDGGVNSTIFEEFQDIFGDFFGFEDIFSGRAEVKIDNIQARSHLWLGKGDAQVENCRGTFSITSGRGPMNVIPFESQISAKNGSSDRKP